MSRPTVVWTLNAIALLALALPFLFMPTMAAHGWMDGGTMMRVDLAGVVWVTLSLVVVTALLVAVLWRRSTS